MLQKYSVENGRLVLNAPGIPRISVYNRPDETERRFLIDQCGLDEHTLISSTDPNETPRIEFEENHAAIIIKYPKNYSAEDNYFFRVKSMGIFLFSAEQSIVIVLDDDQFIFPTGKIPGFQCRTPQDVLLRLLYQIIRHFEQHLRTINTVSDELEHASNGSMENKNLLSMFTLAKGLVYYQNALNGNRRLIERMKSAEAGTGARMIGFTPENLELLEDLAIENQQFLDQSRIYYEVLGGLLDARASIINNDLNVMMKNMNAIVIAISVPTFFTGVGGMSEFTALFAGKAPSYLAYPLFFGLMVLLALVIYWLIQRAYSSR
ncbi:MAG: magnesium transporter CorA family protein [Lentisphaerae bacterium]|nr:magnesium transporter CorA family protein [Lentisphaerota bacterium]